jgi:hypothetical protein
MGESSDQIEEQIHRTREDLRDNLNELQEKVKSVLDWRTHLEARPLGVLTLALGGGMLLGALLPRGANVKQRREHSLVRSEEGRAAEEAEPRKRERERTSNSSLEALKGAFMTATASRIGGFWGQVLAGYRQETERGKRERRSPGYSAT